MNSSIDIHADDYALSYNSDNDILELCSGGYLNSISIIPNLDCFHQSAERLLKLQKALGSCVLLSVHLNFMEGRCCADKTSLPDLVDSDGFFTVSWGKFFLWNYIPSVRKKIKQQLKIEILAQITKCIECGLFCKASLRIDSHQHTHMIPVVFEALKEAVVELENNNCKIEYIRNTQDPVGFYCRKDFFSLNTIKCIILNFYSRKVRKYLTEKKLKQNYLCGVYFSGKMDFRVIKVIPKFIDAAEKQNRIVELLFHPGTMLKSELTDEFRKKGFNEFHLSENRKIEYSALQKMEISK